MPPRDSRRPRQPGGENARPDAAEVTPLPVRTQDSTATLRRKTTGLPPLLRFTTQCASAESRLVGMGRKPAREFAGEHPSDRDVAGNDQRLDLTRRLEDRLVVVDVTGGRRKIGGLPHHPLLGEMRFGVEQ